MFESWQASLIFIMVLFAIVCGLLAALDAYQSYCHRRDEYIPPRDIDASYRTGQFFVPASMRDMKDRGEAS